MSNIVELDGTLRVVETSGDKQELVEHMVELELVVLAVCPGVNMETFKALTHVNGLPVSSTSWTICGGVPTVMFTRYADA